MIDCSNPGSRRRAKSIVLNNGKRLLAVQDELLRCAAIIIGVFGGWRSGKTRGCALKFIANCLANPHTKEYGEDAPFSIVIGLTHKVMVDSAYREIKAILPREAIAHETKGASWELTLRNGHIIKFRTAKGAIEGATACAVWLDEAHLLNDEQTYLNYQIRASDPLGKRFLVLVSGLPESGWLQDTFDRPEFATDPNRRAFFLSTYANTNLPGHVIVEFRKSVSKKASIKLLEGRWMPRENTIYYEYRAQPYPAGHLWDYAGSKEATTHLSVDIGNKGAILFLQEVPRRCRRTNPRTGREEIVTEIGLHVVDELLPDDESVKSAMRMAAARGWRIDPQRSYIFVDPTTRPDEFDSIREVFGEEINIIKKFRGDKAENVEWGHDCVNAALMDVDDNIRLTFYTHLPRTPRSLLTVIPRYHRNKQGKPVRDDVVDHVLDAVRYPVAHIIPITSLLAAA